MVVADAHLSLLCLAGNVLCAIPLIHVVETMRPLAIEPVAGAPDAMSGMSIVRGAPLPIVDVQKVVGDGTQAVERLVVVRVGGRRVGLAFSGVIGARTLPPELLSDLPPLIDRSSGAIAGIGACDGELLLVLDATHIVPEEVFRVLEAKAVAS